MQISSSNSWVLLVAWFSCTQIAFASSEVVINDQMQGCTGGKHVVTTFNRQGDKYVSDKKISITKADLEELIETIKASQSAKEFNPEKLGITPELVKQHYNDMLNAALYLKDPIYKKINPVKTEDFDYPAVCKLAKRRLFLHDRSTNHIKFSTTINEPTVSAEKIEVSSTHEVGDMLPWKVKIGDKKWETFSIELPKKLSKLSPKDGYCAQLLNGNYWTKNFWTDHYFWSVSVGYELHKKHSMQFATLLPGYESAKDKYSIENAYSGSTAFHPDSLILDLKMKNLQNISSATWWNHYKNGEPTADWTQLSKMVSDCEKLINKQTWLVAWKNSNKSNQLHCNIDGFKYYDESNIAEYVMPAWRHAGLKGNPEVGIILSSGKDTRGKIYLSKEDPKALILDAEPAKGSHQFDKLKVSFHPKDPQYIIVGPNGKFERHMIARNSKLLPKWARNLTKEQISEYFDK